MEINFSFVLFNIGSVTGISSLLILLWKYFAKRYSFFQYMKYRPNLRLFPILCKAEKEDCKFIRTGKGIVLIGHTQNNRWIKPYKCLPDVFSESSFLNKEEIYTYKIDFCLLWIIRINRYLKTKKILSVIDKIDDFDVKNCKEKDYYRVDFLKEIESKK